MEEVVSSILNGLPEPQLRAYPRYTEVAKKLEALTAIGKKNCLFAGSKRAWMRAAAIQSLFVMAKLNGIEPTAWLQDTLEKLPAWTMAHIEELLPIKPVA